MKTYVVRKDASGENIFSTLQEAIDALPPTQEPWVIRIFPGIYREKITLQRSHLLIEGMGACPEETILSFDDYAFAPMEEGGRRGTFRSYSFLLDAGHVTLRNLTIENASGDELRAGQAIALYADGDVLTFVHCRFLGRQDTLFTGPLPPKELQPGGFIGPKQFAPRINGRHLYRDCYLCGNVDFIFGSATAYFENCTIESLGRGQDSAIGGNVTAVSTQGEQIHGYVTAPSTPEGQAHGYVFHNCRFLSRECPAESVYLGRPWRDYGKAVFLDCILGAHIHTEGFHDWGKPKAHDTSYFAVYHCRRENGTPFSPTAPFARMLSPGEAGELTPGNVLGRDFPLPSAYFSESAE